VKDYYILLVAKIRDAPVHCKRGDLLTMSEGREIIEEEFSTQMHGDQRNV
jgi:hypothetical protein